jgi:hypothetical protein
MLEGCPSMDVASSWLTLIALVVQLGVIPCGELAYAPHDGEDKGPGFVLAPEQSDRILKIQILDRHHRHTRDPVAYRPPVNRPASPALTIAISASDDGRMCIRSGSNPDSRNAANRS